MAGARPIQQITGNSVDAPTRQAINGVVQAINRAPGRFLGTFAAADMPLTTDNALAYCWCFVTDTHKPAWLDPSYPRWNYADGSAV
jgi:molybdopterin-guanine dinucleotide biosynthesis protein A